MNAVALHNTTISVESRVSATALFEKLREILHISPSIEAIEYETELYFGRDDDFVVRIGMEFGEDDGHKLLFASEDDEDEYVNPHAPYIEVTLSTDADYVSTHGGGAKDLHAAILVELAEWFDDHSAEWGYYTDADIKGNWVSGEYPTKFGNPIKIDLTDLIIN